jgi:hypothetical protein
MNRRATDGLCHVRLRRQNAILLKQFRQLRDNRRNARRPVPRRNDDPLQADERNFYKVEKWTMDGSKGRLDDLCRQRPGQGAGDIRGHGQAPAAD